MPTLYNTRIKIYNDSITYRVETTGGDPSPFPREKLKFHFSFALIFHRVLNAYRLAQAEIFESDDFKILGETLGRILFSSNEDSAMHKDILRLQNVFRDAYIDPDGRCRIYLEFSKDAGTVAMLPWEYLQLVIRRADRPPLEIYPAAEENAKFDLIRSIPGSFNVTEPPRTKQLTILTVVSNCNGPYNVDEQKQMKTWSQRLESRSGGRLKFKTLSTPFNKRSETPPYRHLFLQNLIETVEEIDGPYALHYLGHGKSKNGIASLSFVGHDGEADWLEDKMFAEFFRNERLRKPALICLQACSSGQICRYNYFDSGDENRELRGVGLNLSLEEVPAVVAMQNDITEEDSFVFFEQFYLSLAEGEDVAQAVTRGRTYLAYVHSINRQAVAADPHSSKIFGSPVLFLSAERPFALVEAKSDESETSHSPSLCFTCRRTVEPADEAAHAVICGGKLISMEDVARGYQQQEQRKRDSAPTSIPGKAGMQVEAGRHEKAAATVAISPGGAGASLSEGNAGVPRDQMQTP